MGIALALGGAIFGIWMLMIMACRSWIERAKGGWAVLAWAAGLTVAFLPFLLR